MYKWGIICAADTELSPFLPHFTQRTAVKKAMLTFYEGKIGKQDVVALYSGVCRVNASIAAQILIDSFGVDAILNAGTCGGMDPRLKIFDTVIATEAAYHDLADDILTEFHPWLPTPFFQSDPELLQAARLSVSDISSVYFGRVVTGEQFIEQEQRLEILHRYAPLAVDMETAAVAHVCYVNKIPFLSIRTVTDTGVQSGIDTFEENCEKAAEIAKEVTLRFLDIMNRETSK